MSSALHGLIQQLEASHRFILYRLEVIADKPNKTNKVPCSPETGRNIDAQDSSHWMSGAETQMWAEQWNATDKPPGVLRYGVGVALNGDGLFCIDIDSCRDANGGWMPHAVAFCQQFPCAMVEVSVSGNGLHIFGRAQAGLPPHGNKNRSYNMEAYTSGRFIALGNHAQGDCRTDLTAPFTEFLHRYFPPRDDAADGEWTDAPVSRWSGPADDAELIRRAERAQSGRAFMGKTGSFKDLHHANTSEVVERVYAGDDSAADLAYFNHLAFWCGKDCERMERIALQSGLRREKWDRDDYRRGTILRACAGLQDADVYQGKGDAATVPAVTPDVTVGHPIVPAGSPLAMPPPGKPVPGHPDAPIPAARSLIDGFFNFDGIRGIHHWQSVFMAYSQGIYDEITEDALRSLSWAFFENAAAGAPLKSKQVNEIIKALEGVAYLPEKTPVPCWLDAPTVELPNLLICQNGAIDLTTLELHQTSPKLFATIRLPVDYTPEAGEPKEWLKFLASVWPNDQASIDTLQEMYGLMLTAITKFQKIFLLVGPKRSGKGTILRTLRKLLGVNNVAAPALSTLADPFGMECLIGKLAALIGDARIKARSDKMSVVVERLLSISGEDSPNVARKHRSDWVGRLPTRVVMSSNELPHLDDPSGAMASRFVILVLRESFIGREDMELEEKLALEMSAILNWSLKGRQRLLERGRFMQPASSAAAVEQMAELGSAVAKFIRECCTVGFEHQTPKDTLYRAWRTWCAENGKGQTDSATFGRDLIAAEPRIKSGKATRDAEGKRPTIYAGIALTSSLVQAPV